MKVRVVLLNANYYYIKSTEYDADSPETLFSSPWTIVPKIKSKKIEEIEETHAFGELTFRGMHKNGRVFLDYKLKKNIAPDDFSYIIDCMRDWAFSQTNVYSMQVSNIQDAEKIESLKKLGYTADDSEPDSFVVHKEQSSYKLFYIFIGAIMGLCFGGCIERLIIGLIIGLILGSGVGFSIGYSLDMREKTHRRSIERTGAE